MKKLLAKDSKPQKVDDLRRSSVQLSETLGLKQSFDLKPLGNIKKLANPLDARPLGGLGSLRTES